MVSMLAFTFKNIRPIIFSAANNISFPKSSNFSTIKQLFHSQGTFPQSRKFSIVKELFHSQGTFHNLFTVKELFHSQGTFHNQGTFPQSRNFSTVVEISTKNEVFYSQGSFSQKKITSSNKFSTNKKDFQKNLFP